jgi:hypothetical protein
VSQEDERLKSLSDFELEIEAQQINPKQWKDGHPVIRELFVRRQQKENDNKQTQEEIKKMTAIILKLTAAALAIAIVTLIITVLVAIFTK